MGLRLYELHFTVLTGNSLKPWRAKRKLPAVLLKLAFPWHKSFALQKRMPVNRSVMANLKESAVMSWFATNSQADRSSGILSHTTQTEWIGHSNTED